MSSEAAPASNGSCRLVTGIPGMKPGIISYGW